MVLKVSKNSPSSVFGMQGSDENSATFALGWALEKSPTLASLLLKTIFKIDIDASNIIINLQKHDSDGGYTDIELQSGNQFHVLIEAKRWWDVPTIGQLVRYLPRLLTSEAHKKIFVSVSQANHKMAMRKLPAQLESIDITHLSWTDLQKIAVKALANTSQFQEKLWLKELVTHLEEYTIMNRETSNLVFVVPISNDVIKETGYPWLNVVEKDLRYFHMIGNNWPKEPPNYIAFRYAGKLLSVHHIDSFDVEENLNLINANWPSTDIDHFVYHLSPPIKPKFELKSGNVYGPGHCWCAIDTLLSGAYSTVKDASDATKTRLESQV